jgi:hypothetical protein
LIKAEYRELCRDISLALGAEEPEALFESGRIEVDGDVVTMLFFSEDVDANTLFCYVDLGEIAQEKRADVYQNLLELNLLTGSKTNAVFALDPASGHAILVSHISVATKPEADAVVKKLRLYALQAESMRDTLLAGSIDGASPASQSALRSLTERA